MEQAERDGVIDFDEKDGKVYHICSVCKRSQMKYMSLIIDADHENKNVLDNDLANLSWKCRSCHKEADQKTAKGVSTVDESTTRGYGSY